MTTHAWHNNPNSEKRFSKKAMSKVLKHKQVACSGCGITATKMELATGEMVFHRINGLQYCELCCGAFSQEVVS